jgi:hypothetical protein
VPVRRSGYWYLVVANFRDRRFEVICPFKDKQIIQQDALIVVSNFKRVFDAVHARFARIQIYKMETVIGSVSKYNNKLSSTHKNDVTHLICNMQSHQFPF